MLRDSRSNPGTGSGPPRYPGTFLLAVREAVDRLNWKIQRWLGDAIRCVDAEGEEHTVGLENLFRRTRRQQRDTWPVYIAEFLSKVRLTEENRGDRPGRRRRPAPGPARPAVRALAQHAERLGAAPRRDRPGDEPGHRPRRDHVVCD